MRTYVLGPVDVFTGSRNLVVYEIVEKVQYNIINLHIDFCNISSNIDILLCSIHGIQMSGQCAKVFRFPLLFHNDDFFVPSFI